MLNLIKQKQDVCVCPAFSYKPSSEEEAVLIHVEFASHFQDFSTHLKTKQQLVYLKQATTCVPAKGNTLS